MGSKNRIAKEIIPIILKNRKPNQWFIDLFCGGCNLIDKIDGKRIANDKNKYLIAMWKGLQKGRKLTLDIPKELFSEARTEYNNRTNIKFDDFEIGWIGFMGGFNGRFYGGGYSGIHGTRNYVQEQIRNTLKQVDKIKDIKFYNRDYSEFNFKEPVIIYCDIPYFATKEYDTKDKFNYEKFWNWVRKTSKLGHEIYISEYTAPEDMKCIWSKEVKVSIRPDKTLNQTERLFTYKD